MHMTASSVYDRETIRALTRFLMFRKYEPKKRLTMWTVIYAALIAVLILEMVLWGYSPWQLILVLACIAVMLLELYLFFRLPELRYKRMGKLAGIRNEYVFTDTHMDVTSSGEGYTGAATAQYELLRRVYETDACLYLYVDGNRCYIVDKSTLQGGTAEELRALLVRFVGRKYIRCNY